MSNLGAHHGHGSAFARIALRTMDVHGFDHTANWVAKVRNVSRVGSQSPGWRPKLTTNQPTAPLTATYLVGWFARVLTGRVRRPAHGAGRQGRGRADRWFRQEYLCEFEDSVSGLSERDLVIRAITEDVKPLLIP